MGKHENTGYLWMICATMFPAWGHALECSIFPETQESSTSAYYAAPKVWIDGVDESKHEATKIRTAEQSQQIAGRSFVTPSAEFTSCESKVNPYSNSIITSTCSGKKVYARTDFGDYTMRMATISATFYRDGIASRENYRWGIAENEVILRLDPNDPATILHVQYVRTSEGYYSCN